MHYIQQPKKSRQCGQHALAMVTGKSVEEIIKIIGTNKGTTTKQIISVLNQLGFKNSERLITRGKKELPSLSICKVRREWNKSGGWHWVVVLDGIVYDPDPSPQSGIHEIMPIAQYDEQKEKAKQKLSSYIEIY